MKRLLLLLLVAQPVLGQDTSFLKTYSQTRGFLLGRPQKPKVTPDEKFVLFLRSPADSRVQSLYELEVATGQTRLVASPQSLLGGQDEKLSVAEKARRERQRLQTSGFADFWVDDSGKRVLLPLSGQLYLLDRASGKARKLPAAGPIVDPQWSPDFRSIAYVRNHDLYVLDVLSGRERALTRGGTDAVTHGEAEFVAQEEMRRDHGFWWSPDSQRLAYEEADMRGVETWYLADPFQPGNAPVPQRYPRPGHPNAKVRLGLISARGGPTTWLDWNRKDYEYLGAVRWDPQGPLTVQLQNRPQTRTTLFRVDGKRLVPLLDQRDDRWVNLRQDGPFWLKGGKSFVMPVEQSLILWENGKQRTLVPEGQDLTQVLGLHGDEVRCRVESPPGVGHVLTVNVKTGAVSQTAEGVTDAVYRKGTGVLTTHTLEHLPETTVNERVLPSVAQEPALPLHVERVPLDRPGWEGIVVKPADFDPARSYPVVLDVYGGPHHLHAVPTKRNWLVDQWLANQGFLVVAVDNRGTPGRGEEWEKAVFGRFGTVPLEDQVAGLQALAQKVPQLDLSRVGVVGWSFGGYLAAQAVLARPDIFKAAVSGAPVTDWHDYDTHYTERYLGVPPAAEPAYEAASLLPLASKLERPLLLVHGTADDNVYFRHSLKLADALLRAGKPFEMLPLPGLTHSYTSDALVTERLWSTVAAFFGRHLR